MSYSDDAAAMHDALRATPGWARARGALEDDDVAAILAEAARVAEAVVAPLNPIADRIGAAFENGAVRTPEAFRAAATEFDTRVQEIRRQQDAKERDITTRVQRAQEAFLGVVQPVLGQIMIEAGAAVILDRRTVVLGRNAIDITDTAIARIDDEIGDGPGLAALEDAADPVEQ